MIKLFAKIMILANLLAPTMAFAYITHCAGGYCANAGSPVVGFFGELVGQNNTDYGPFYCVDYWGSVNRTYSYAWRCSCPPGTVSFEVPPGSSYTADNGVTYTFLGTGSWAVATGGTLCVLQDNTSGWYGGAQTR